ncbi:fatty acid alpha-hydroxylase [Balamuthia mandrillaris]
MQHRRRFNIARSPHWVELLLSYGLATALCFAYSLCFLGTSYRELLAFIFVGGSLYTFFEYWFHRILLHRDYFTIPSFLLFPPPRDDNNSKGWGFQNPIKTAHDRHHQRPRQLRIIATPIFPVQCWDAVVVSLLCWLLDKKAACGINCGIALGQMAMDATHMLFHSRHRPWLLESARSYHLFHHRSSSSSTPPHHRSTSLKKEKKEEEENEEVEVAHGLTTPFWDMVFGTFPYRWRVYQRHPWLRFLQLPFPLLSFILMSVLSRDSSSSPSSTLSTSNSSFFRLCTSSSKGNVVSSSLSSSTLLSSSPSSLSTTAAFAPIDPYYLLTTLVGTFLFTIPILC